jgi:protein SCO1
MICILFRIILNLSPHFLPIPNQMLKIKYLFFIALFFILAPSIMKAQGELGIYEHLDQYIPDDLTFVTEKYDTVNLLDQIDKPTVIVPVYYECPGLCSPLLEGVADVISKATMELGKDYQVFTISFNPAEKSRLAAEKKANYARLIKNGSDVEHGWIFHTGDSINIDRLLNSLGYKIKREGKEWIHPGAIIVLSPEGKITRYLHGTYFLPFDLKMAVVEASHGKSGPTINKMLKFCFSYDAEGKKYVFNITKVSGSLIMLFAIGFFISLVVKSKKNKKPFVEN